MKKKIFAICLAVALIAILSFGTLAWFSDTDEITNTFTIGSVKIVQNEKEHNDEGELVDFTQNQYILPVGEEDTFATDDNYIEKIVTVTSTGENEAYVRTFIAVPTALKDIIVLDVNTGKWVKEDAVTTQDIALGTQMVNYTVYAYTYTEALAKDESTETLLKGVYMKETVDLQVNPDESTATEEVYQFCTKNADGSYTFYDYNVELELHIPVATQGVQARGFANADAALDTAFPNAPTLTVTLD